MAEEEPLGENAAGGVDAKLDSCGLPSTKGRYDVVKEFRSQRARSKSGFPDATLQGFESGRFAVLIHQAMDSIDGVGDRCVAAEFLLAPWIARVGRSTFHRQDGEGISKIFVLPMAFEKRSGLAAHEWEHDVVHEADVGNGPFDIEQRASRFSMKLVCGSGFRHDQGLGLDQRLRIALRNGIRFA